MFLRLIRSSAIKAFAFLLILSWVASSGCSKRESGPPPPLAAEQLPVEFDKGFAKAKPGVKDLAARVSSAVQAKDYAAAHQAIQALCGAADTTKAQKLLAQRALLTISDLLNAAQAQGDQKAAETLQSYRISK
jgi:hypothetical protein